MLPHAHTRDLHSFPTRRSSDLQEAKLQTADLTGANLTGVDLAGADMRLVRASNANFTDAVLGYVRGDYRSEEHTSELQSQFHLVCRLLLEKKKRDRSVDRTLKT